MRNLPGRRPTPERHRQALLPRRKPLGELLLEIAIAQRRQKHIVGQQEKIRPIRAECQPRHHACVPLVQKGLPHPHLGGACQLDQQRCDIKQPGDLRREVGKIRQLFAEHQGDVVVAKLAQQHDERTTNLGAEFDRNPPCKQQFFCQKFCRHTWACSKKRHLQNKLEVLGQQGAIHRLDQSHQRSLGLRPVALGDECTYA